MKKSTKISADKDLAKIQFKEMNKKFYSNYMSSYYSLKLQNLLYIISHSKDYQNQINGCEVEIGRLKTTFGGVGTEEVKEYAKLEIANMYFHCLETFIRLFIAHGSKTLCPWLEMSRLNQRKYKKALEKLSKGDFNWINEELDENEITLLVITGSAEAQGSFTKEDIEGLKTWIIFAAEQLLKTYEYNSFKHGLTVYTNTNGFKFMQKDEIKLEKHGECLQFLSTKEKDDRYVWVENTVFISYDSKATIVWIFMNLIKNIINVGNYYYVDKSKGCDFEFIPNHKLTPRYVLAEDKQMTVEGISMELLYKKSNNR